MQIKINEKPTRFLYAIFPVFMILLYTTLLIIFLIEDVEVDIAAIITFLIFISSSIIALILIFLQKNKDYLFTENDITIYKNKLFFKKISLEEIEYFRFYDKKLYIKISTIKKHIKIKKMEYSEVEEVKELYPHTLFFIKKARITNYQKSILISLTFIGGIISLYLLFFFLFPLDTKYGGDYPELYTEAINSLVGSCGYINGSERVYDPYLEIIEEDEYGRILFYYTETNEINGFSLLISQKSYMNKVYYYQDYNFISKKYIRNDYNHINYFTLQEIEEFKSRNDWNEDIDLDKCISKNIVRQKIKPEIKIREKDFEAIFRKYAADTGYKGTDYIYRFSYFSTEDKYGRLLYYAYGIGRDAEGKGVSPKSVYRDFDLIIIFNPDGSYDSTICVIELIDYYNYQTILAEFKQLNNWDQEWNRINL